MPTLTKRSEKARPKAATSTLATAKLKKYLPALLFIADRKTTIPALSQFLFSGGKIITSNLDVSLTLDGALSGDVDTCILAHSLGAFLALVDADLQITSEDKDGLKSVLRTGTVEVSLDVLSSKNFPSIPVPSGEWTEINASDFMCMVRRVRRSTSNEESRYTLNGALLQAFGTTLRMVSTDGHRMSVCEMQNADTSKLEKAMLISACALHVISLTLDAAEVDAIFIAADETHNHYKIGPLTISERQLKGQFPNWESVMKMRGKETVATVNVNEMVQALKLARVFADPRSGCVRLAVDGNSIRITAKDYERGEFSHNVPATIAGEKDFKIGFAVQSVLDFFLGIEGEAEMSFKDSATMGAFKQKDKDDFEYVIMPMRT